MKRTKDEIEGPILKNGFVLAAGILVLLFMLGLGVFLLVEALQMPEGPQDELDMNRMLISGIGVILFTVAVSLFMISLYKPKKKNKGGKTKPRTARKKVSKRK